MAKTSMSPASRKAAIDRYKPIWKAYVFAYLSLSAPRILSLAIALLRRRSSVGVALTKAASTIRHFASIDRLPACAALLVAGSLLGPRVLAEIWISLARYAQEAERRAVRLRHQTTFKFLAAFLSSLTVFKLLNLRPSRPIPSTYASAAEDGNPFSAQQSRESRTSVASRRSNLVRSSPPPINVLRIPTLAGRTIDLTTFGVVHASVVLGSVALESYRQRQSHGRLSRLIVTKVERLAAPFGFITSCAIIMGAWFYSPDRLPSSYNAWITSAAKLDPRFLEALRQARYGTFKYGTDTGLDPLLGNMARDLGLPAELGHPSTRIPIDCEVYHSGTGASCEYHALSRFLQGFKFAFRMYLPLNLLMLVRRGYSKDSMTRVFASAAQSSAFLGAFIALNYYGVCLGRTRLGPRLLGTDIVSRQMLDGGICVATGCMMCGWSIFVEKEARRMEMGLFVAPRALSTLLPRRYDSKYIWREQLAFALSAATIITAARTRPDRVKGVFGRFVQQVMT